MAYGHRDHILHHMQILVSWTQASRGHYSHTLNALAHQGMRALAHLVQVVSVQQIPTQPHARWLTGSCLWPWQL